MSGLILSAEIERFFSTMCSAREVSSVDVMRSPIRHSPPRRRTLRGLALVAGLATASLALLTACAPVGSPPESTASTSAAADLSRFQEQELDWGDCAPTATTETDAALYANPLLECASVEMPIDYDDPEGDTGAISMLRLPASGEKEGSLLVNPGGPGGSGNNFVAALFEQWQASPINERFDIVGFDPRGVGATTPRAECFTDEENDRGLGFRVSTVYEVPSAEAAADIAERCIEGTGGAERLASISTTNTVHDMDLMRAVLGDDKLSFFGFSYGSELGAAYARMYPENARAIAIDGVIAPDLTAAEFRVTQMVALQSSFDDLAAACATSPDCVLGADPAGASERLREILSPLVDAPATTQGGREVTIWDAYTGIIGGMYSEAKWPDVTAALAEFDAGSADGLLALRDTYFSRGADGRYGLDFDSNVATRCMDWPALTADEQTKLARDAADAAPFIDLPVFTKDVHHECEAWPEPANRGVPWLPEAEGDVPPTLVVSVTGDPATPHTGAVAMADELGGSLLTVEGKQHGAFLVGGSECVDDAVADYILELETPAESAVCALP